MGRLKREHGGYRTSGLWLKYQSPKIDETSVRSRSKKDTTKWCRGKVGREHEWHKFQEPKWSDELWGYENLRVSIRCINCGKGKYTKTAKAANYPLHIWVDEKYCGVDPVQVRINGEYKTLTLYDYKKDKYYCHECGYCH